MADTVRVSRALLVAALADAIGWTESLADAERGVGRKFEPRPDTLRRLARYRREYERLTGHGFDLDSDYGGTSVSVTELVARGG